MKSDFACGENLTAARPAQSDAWENSHQSPKSPVDRASERFCLPLHGRSTNVKRSMQFIRGTPDWRLTDRQHHEAFAGETALLDELPLVGRMHLLDALPNALVSHAHPGIYEAHFVVGGSMG